jgi:hypothetical protein
MHFEHAILEAGLDLEDLLAQGEGLRGQGRQHLTTLGVGRSGQRGARRGWEDAAASRPDERACCSVCCAHTFAREPDRDVDAHCLCIPKRPEELLERRGNVSVGEVSSVEYDRDPAAAACIDSGSHRHSTDRRSFDVRPAKWRWNCSLVH